MSTQTSLNNLPFGLLELDAAGTVMHYSPALERNPTVKSNDILGRNFFTEVLTASEIKAHQARFRLFMAQGQTVDKFSTTFPSEDGQIKVQIMLARVLDKSNGVAQRLALVRIMPEEGFA
jgi:photoactive yellow protein